MAGWPRLSPHTEAGALPFSRSLREGGGLADIASAGHRIHAKLLTTARRPARFNLDRTSSWRAYATTSRLRQATSPEHPRASKPRLAGIGADSLTLAEVASPSSSGPFVFPVMMGLLATVS